MLCDSEMGMELKSTVYKAVVRLAMLDGADTWPIKQDQERKIEVAEMRMLRRICGKERQDKELMIRGTVKVAGYGGSVL